MSDEMRLALTAVAMSHGLRFDKAWDLVNEVAAGQEQDIPALGRAVSSRAERLAYGAFAG